MSEKESIKFAKGFGYKTQEVDNWVDKFLLDKMNLEADIEKLKKEVRALKQEKEQAEKKNSELSIEYDKIKEAEIKRVDEFSSLMDSGKRIVNQMMEDAKQESAETIYTSNKVLEEAKEEAERMKSRTIQDVKSISALLAEIAKTSAKSKAQVVSLYDQIDTHYQEFVEEVQKKASEIFPKEE